MNTLGMMVCMPQLPLTTWLTEKSTPTVMAVIAWSSVRLNAVIMKSLREHCTSASGHVRDCRRPPTRSCKQREDTR